MRESPDSRSPYRAEAVRPGRPFTSSDGMTNALMTAKALARALCAIEAAARS
jgi:hypothetical protein